MANSNSEISRSWLLVNAMREEQFDEAAKSRADEIILDVEDAVAPEPALTTWLWPTREANAFGIQPR
jgi:hypothetical protein